MATLCLLGNDGAMAGRREIGDEPMTVGRGAAVDLVRGLVKLIAEQRITAA